MAEAAPVEAPGTRDAIAARVDRVGGAGRCNTPPAAKVGRPSEITGGGIDTLKVVTYLADDRSLRALEQPGLSTFGTGASLLVAPPDRSEWPLPGTRAFYYPGRSLLGIEGHPAGERGVLFAGDDVPGWADELTEALGAWGVRAHELGVARCDGAVDVATSPAYGRAVMGAVAAVVPPRAKLETFRSGDGIETVYYVGRRGAKRARFYDSGVAYGTAERFTTLRAEDQRRYDRPSRRLDARELTTAVVRDAHRERWGALAKATKGVTVGTTPVLVDKVGVMVESGELRVDRGARLLGALQLLGSGYVPAERTARRWRSELRELGLVQLEGELEPVELNVGELLEQVVDEAVWR